MCGLCLSMIYDFPLKMLQSKFRGELTAWEHSERGNVYTYTWYHAELPLVWWKQVVKSSKLALWLKSVLDFTCSHVFWNQNVEPVSSRLFYKTHSESKLPQKGQERWCVGILGGERQCLNSYVWYHPGLSGWWKQVVREVLKKKRL